MKYQEIKGDLIKLAVKKEFDVIAHGCNCLSNMGAGLAPKMARVFDCDKYELESWGRTIEKLGCIDYQSFCIDHRGVIWNLSNAKESEDAFILTVVNAYTQYKYGRNHRDGVERPLDYEALTLCMRKINEVFKGKHIGLPQIGAGLAGGDWNKIKGIIQEELRDCKVTVVIYEKN